MRPWWRRAGGRLQASWELLEAAEGGDAAAAEKLIGAGADLETRGQVGCELDTVNWGWPAWHDMRARQSPAPTRSPGRILILEGIVGTFKAG